jgi:hypothetical protein
MNLKRRACAIYNRIVHRDRVRAELESLNFADGRMDVLMKHPSMQIIAAEVGKFFADMGASNYVEMTMFDVATMQTYALVIQKVGRPTPHEVNAQLREALETIDQQPEIARPMADLTLRSLGYKRRDASNDAR